MQLNWNGTNIANNTSQLTLLVIWCTAKILFTFASLQLISVNINIEQNSDFFCNFINKSNFELPFMII